MRKCKTCNNDFSAKDPRKQYCSDKCKWTFDNKKALKKVADKKREIKVEDLPNEIWKDVENYEGLYQISNFGRVKGMFNAYQTKRGNQNINLCFPERILKGSITTYGYLKYILNKENKFKDYFSHRLIASAFISNPNNLETVNHMDGDKLNNSISNLEWCSLSNNVKHAWKTGLNKPYIRINGVKGIRKKQNANL